ncbi:MAG TPA: hypothetical protein ENH99_02805 [Candidatus Pacearchaeota archaeon]|nr:hypothetical protein [Candidatus Pacearchaeota archaeon]
MARVLKEGVAFNRWADGRFKKNKNILLAMTGMTGSGKSYTSLRMCELYYQEKFNKPFQIENVCFSISELMKLLTSKTLKRGEMIILEEAGTSLNSLDYQNKVSKLFSFILQSFRSMNIGLIFTLPVLTMLNKSARMLLHAHYVTSGIDFYTKTCKIKPLYHQLNQERGKSYWKFQRIKVNGEIHTIKRLNFLIPSKELRDAYEKKKNKFVYDLSEDFVNHLNQIERDQQRKMARDDLSDVERDIFEDVVESGLTPSQSAEKRGRTKSSTYDGLRRIKEKGFPIEKWIRYRETKSPKLVKAQIAKIKKKESKIKVST